MDGQLFTFCVLYFFVLIALLYLLGYILHLSHAHAAYWLATLLFPIHHSLESSILVFEKFFPLSNNLHHGLNILYLHLDEGLITFNIFGIIHQSSSPCHLCRYTTIYVALLTLKASSSMDLRSSPALSPFKPINLSTFNFWLSTSSPSPSWSSPTSSHLS